MPTTASTEGRDFCPRCGRPLAQDLLRRGFRRHTRRPATRAEECEWEVGERRLPPAASALPRRPEKLEGYLTTEETATALGTTKQNVHKMIRDGRLANVRFIGTGKPILLIPTAEVDDRSLRAARDDRELRDNVYGDDD